jgi:hypothetical protein
MFVIKFSQVDYIGLLRFRFLTLIYVLPLGTKNNLFVISKFCQYPDGLYPAEHYYDGTEHRKLSKLNS